MRAELQTGSPRSSPTCPFRNSPNMHCLLCAQPRARSPVFDGHTSPPRRRAPLAPMYEIWPEELDPRQVRQFGGIKWAVDICGEEDKVVLLEMKTPAFGRVLDSSEPGWRPVQLIDRVVKDSDDFGHLTKIARSVLEAQENMLTGLAESPGSAETNVQ